MGLMDKAKDKAQQLAGKGKQRVGDATDNESLEAEGHKDEAVGKLKEAGEDLKDRVAEKFNRTQDDT